MSSDVDIYPEAVLHHSCKLTFKVNPVTFTQSKGVIRYGELNDTADVVNVDYVQMDPEGDNEVTASAK
jgi:hypothetical protein